MSIFVIVVVIYFGLVIGSFLGALTYRFPRGVSVARGRSICPKCKSQIAWFDNIPLLSFLWLYGRCRHCHKKISYRYPIVEVTTLVFFLVIYLLRSQIFVNLAWVAKFEGLGTVYLLFLASLLISILVIDFEHQIVPDEFVFCGILVSVIFYLLAGFPDFYSHLMAGFIASFVLLAINLLTFGRGMGLGDVKLAVFLGFVLGPSMSIVWFLLSFVIGGIVALLLIFWGTAKIHDRIAFAPFLIVGFAVTIISYEALHFGLF